MMSYIADDDRDVLLEKMRGLPPVAHAPPIKVRESMREETLVVRVVRVVRVVVRAVLCVGHVVK